MAIFKRKAPTVTAAHLLDIDAMPGNDATRERWADLMWKWERFATELEPGEKRSVVLHANLFAPPPRGDSTDFRPIGTGLAFFSDRRMFLDRDITRGKRIAPLVAPQWTTMPYSQITYFGPDPRTDKGWMIAGPARGGGLRATIFGWDDPDPQYIVDALGTALHLMRAFNQLDHAGCVCAKTGGTLKPFENPHEERP